MVITMTENSIDSSMTEKRRDVISFFKEQNASIVCLQDTHLTLVTDNDVMALKAEWNNNVFISGGKTNSRGVAILLNNNFEHEVLSCNKDNNGNYLNSVLKLPSMTINLTALYGPNNDSPAFFQEVEKILDHDNADYNILCGDFNIALNQEIDTYKYKQNNNPLDVQS